MHRSRYAGRERRRNKKDTKTRKGGFLFVFFDKTMVVA
jgi:hypothetical protein